MTRKISAPDTLNSLDMADYAAIREYVPEAAAKQTKWLKEMFDTARSMGCDEPLAEQYLKLLENIDPPFRLQFLAGLKSSIMQAKKARSELSEYQQTGQTNLFHPEAFDQP